MAKRIVRQSHKHRAVPPLPIHSVGESGRPAAVLTLAALGLLAWLAIGPGRGIGAVRWVLIAVAAASACIPAIANAIGRALDRIRQPSRKAMNRAAIVIALIAAGYFVLTAFNQDRDLFPKTHDDCGYAIGMQMLARGRVWIPALALPDFFDAFYILVRPVYCSLYFPGTALLYAPGVWLHLPIWLMPALASGAVVGVMYRIVAELIDGAAGMLAALMMVSLSWFRVYSVLITSHVPMLLLGLLMVLAWMRWRQRIDHRVGGPGDGGPAGHQPHRRRPAKCTALPPSHPRQHHQKTKQQHRDVAGDEHRIDAKPTERNHHQRGQHPRRPINQLGDDAIHHPHHRSR